MTRAALELSRIGALSIALALTRPAVASPQTPPVGNRARSIAAAEARRALAQGPIAGVSVLVMERGKVTFSGGFGSAELDNEVPATQHTVYRINSITKAFTATLILQLAERGKLRLDDPLSLFLPEYVQPGFDPTLRQLLTHTGGVTNYGGATFHRWIRLGLTPRQWVDSVSDHLYVFPPGTNWSYSNAGYEILGLVASKASGMALDSLLRQRILVPAGLTETYRCNTPAVLKHRASSYEWNAERFSHAESWGTYGDASARLCSTVGDLGRFLRALEGGTLLSARSLAIMRSPGRLSSGNVFDYGLGTRLGYLDRLRLMAYTGSGEGWTSCMVELPERGLTVIALANTDAPSWPAERIAVDILRSLAGMPERPPRDRAAPDALVERMLGRWQTFGGPDVEIVRAGTHLAVRGPTGPESLPMLYQGGTEFRSGPPGPSPALQLVVDTAVGRTTAGVYAGGIFRQLSVRDSAR